MLPIYAIIKTPPVYITANMIVLKSVADYREPSIKRFHFSIEYIRVIKTDERKAKVHNNGNIAKIISKIQKLLSSKIRNLIPNKIIT